MCKIEKFLGIYELETGGLLIGWFNFIVFCSISVFFIVLPLVLSIHNWQGGEAFLRLLIFFLFLASTFGFFANISNRMIEGVEKRNHWKVHQFLVLNLILFLARILLFLVLLIAMFIDPSIMSLEILRKFLKDVKNVIIACSKTTLITSGTCIILEFTVQSYILLVVRLLYKRFENEYKARISRDKLNVINVEEAEGNITNQLIGPKNHL